MREPFPFGQVGRSSAHASLFPRTCYYFVVLDSSSFIRYLRMARRPFPDEERFPHKEWLIRRLSIRTRWNMFAKGVMILSVALSFSFLGYSQGSAKVPVLIKAILLDRDLNQKPVAKNKFRIMSADSQTLALETTTGFDGMAQV